MTAYPDQKIRFGRQVIGMEHGGDIYRNKVKLDFSVSLNPHPVPDKVMNAYHDAGDLLSHYPDLKQERLREKLAFYHSISTACVLAGNGASSILMGAVRCIDPDMACITEPGFSGYRHVTGALTKCSLTVYRDSLSGIGFSLDDLKKALTGGTDLLILQDPVNPSGRNIPNEDMEKCLEFADRNGMYVILDQSFYLLSEKGRNEADIAQLINKYNRLFIVRSFTKLFSVPGIRMGYVISSEKNIKILERNLPEWDLSIPADLMMQAGIDELTETDFVNESLDMIKKEREYLEKSLKTAGLFVYPSDTVFIMFKGPRSLYDRLLEKGILIRRLESDDRENTSLYRIAVRDLEANTQLTEAIMNVL